MLYKIADYDNRIGEIDLRNGKSIIFYSYEGNEYAAKLVTQMLGESNDETEMLIKLINAGVTNIIDVIDIGHYDVGFERTSRILMKRGTDCIDYVKKLHATDPETSFEKTMSIIKDFAKGMLSITNARFMHLDIKSGNLIVMPDGTARIIDFELTRETTCTVFYEGEFFGTEYYSSPEKLNVGKQRVIDNRSEVWSVAIVIAELLCRKQMAELFDECETFDLSKKEEAKKITDVLLKLIEDSVESPLKREFIDLLSKCFVFKAENRISLYNLCRTIIEMEIQ